MKKEIRLIELLREENIIHLRIIEYCDLIVKRDIEIVRYDIVIAHYLPISIN